MESRPFGPVEFDVHRATGRIEGAFETNPNAAEITAIVVNPGDGEAGWSFSTVATYNNGRDPAHWQMLVIDSWKEGPVKPFVLQAIGRPWDAISGQCVELFSIGMDAQH